MAQDIFIKISGIDGESQDAAHKNEIEVKNWGWEISQQSSMHMGSGGGAGKAAVEDLSFEHLVDRASPNLMKYCLTGKHIDQALLTVRKAGGNPLEYLKITMNDVVVTKVQPSGSNSDTGIRELVRLSFARVKQEYVVQNAQGGSGGAVTASYDIKLNKEA
ncbi:Hcp family type VI secretion system effector [Caballeronia ptereochthonis]|uniref:Hcp1 family type VI secretion system effector n=1 Tax=Caballeronia ptereochthonis TaxID=1777144 RepID=A0A158A8P7_9BURK|nr:type VI secretion system tube protein Hcp [Caballeronia ptereochthonis]SAK54163.1 Hcp1 family type VI secretion system effector [Caballeronia ptereochthonis]